MAIIKIQPYIIDSTQDFTFNNVTSTGNLVALNANLGNAVVANYFVGNGALLTGISVGTTYSNSNVGAYLPTYSGNLTAGNILTNNLLYANGVAWSFAGIYSNSNVGAYLPTYSGLVGGTLTTSAQPNITSVGTLTSLTVSGDTTISGNLTVSGSFEYANVTSFRVKDPIIEQGGNTAGGALTSNDGYDRGQLLHYYSTKVVDAFMGWDNSNAEFAFGSNVSVSSEVVTFNTFGNVRAGYFIGDGSQLTGISVGTSYSNSNVAAYLPTYTGNLTAGNVSVTGNITATLINTTGASGNITGVNYMNANFYIGNGSLLTGLPASYSNANVAAYLPTYSGNLTAGNANISGNITAAAIITSGVSGNITGVNYITANYFVGNGSLLTGISSGGGTSYANSNVAAYLPTYTGNISAGNVLTNNLLYANGVAWSFAGLYSNTNVGAYLSTYSGLIGGTLTTTAQPNITSVGTLTSLSVTGNISGANLIGTVYGNGSSISSLTGANVIGNVANAVHAFVSDSANSVTGANVIGNVANAVHAFVSDSANSVTGANVSGQVANALVAGTVYNPAQTNITSVGTLTSLAVTGGVTIGGNLTVNGTLTSINSTIVEIDDLAIVLANDATTMTQANGAGIIINGANASFLYNSTSNSLVSTHKITADGSLLTSLTGANVSGNVANALHAFVSDSANSVAGANVSGNVANAVHAFVSDSANSVAGANVSGQVSNALIAGTVYVNAQPNITSVGTLTSLSITGNITAGNANISGNSVASYFVGNGYYLTGISSGGGTSYSNSNVSAYLSSSNVAFGGANVFLGSVSNLHITGGTSGQVLTTNGSGTISWATVTTGGTTSNSAYVFDVFSGNGVQTQFTLSSTPAANTVLINYNGALQLHSAYSVSGNVVTLVEAPANGSVVEAITLTGSSSGSSGSVDAAALLSPFLLMGA